MSAVRIETCTGTDVAGYLGDLARLRIEVFRAFPYLYEGDLDYERGYLATYAEAPDSLFVLALDGERVVGASTGVPMDQEAAAISDPWRTAGIDPARVYYFGESVLLAQYRGLGVGHCFFDQREAHAARLGRFQRTTFCAVDRPDDHPRRPPDYRPLQPFWRRRGYHRHNDLACHMSWREPDHPEPVSHRLSFWSHLLPRQGHAPA